MMMMMIIDDGSTKFFSHCLLDTPRCQPPGKMFDSKSIAHRGHLIRKKVSLKYSRLRLCRMKLINSLMILNRKMILIDHFNTKIKSLFYQYDALCLENPDIYLKSLRRISFRIDTFRPTNGGVFQSVQTILISC